MDGRKDVHLSASMLFFAKKIKIRKFFEKIKFKAS